MNRDTRKILADLKRHLTFADLTQGGTGDDLCKAFTDGVAATIERQETPDGTKWADLSPAYEEYKSKRFPGQPIGKAHVLMADPVQIAGDVIVLDDAAMVTYGTDQDARDEAEHFQEGNPSGNQPPRPFWGFTSDSTAAVEKVLDDRFKDVVG